MDRMDRHICGGDRRSPGAQKLTYVMSVRLSDSQRDAARAAAKRAGMALSAWVGELVVDAAEHRALPIGWLQREVVQELIRLRREFTMAVDSLNQIALELNSEGAISSDLETVIGRLRDLIIRAERVTEAVRRRM
jgi:antitoxin component of RelBE/YafQ-DinJ toxin-antitoxin module